MKFCIFCGRFPNSKNKEHVIPQWLIKLTGNPKRVVNFGDDFTEDLKTFDWTSFVFPSCVSCNENWSNLESKVRPVIEKIIDFKEIKNEEIFFLLDWIDKVRVGLWLGYYYLFNNPEGIEPHFFINSRTAKEDRLLNIHIFNKSASDGINAFGIETPIFKRQPSCFGLRINNILLVSVSDSFLVSGVCGFTPYPKNISIDKKGSYRLSDFVYKKKITKLGFSMHPGQISIAQPIHKNYKDMSDIYHSYDILNNNYLDFENKIGDVYIYKQGKYLFSNKNNIKYQNILDIKNIKDIMIEIYETQIQLYMKDGTQNILSKDHIRYFEKYIELKIKQIESINW
jgi:hypothetical protein